MKESKIKVLFLLTFPLSNLQKIDMALNNYDIILHSKKTHSLFENGRRSSSLGACKTSGKWHGVFFPLSEQDMADMESLFISLMFLYSFKVLVMINSPLNHELCLLKECFTASKSSNNGAPLLFAKELR